MELVKNGKLSAKAILALSKAASRDATRDELRSVRVECIEDSTIAVATDGHILVAAIANSTLQNPVERHSITFDSLKRLSNGDELEIVESGEIKTEGMNLNNTPTAKHFPDKWRCVVENVNGQALLEFNPKVLLKALMVCSMFGNRALLRIKQDRQFPQIQISMPDLDDGISLYCVVLPISSTEYNLSKNVHIPSKIPPAEPKGE